MPKDILRRSFTTDAKKDKQLKDNAAKRGDTFSGEVNRQIQRGLLIEEARESGISLETKSADGKPVILTDILPKNYDPAANQLREIIDQAKGKKV